MPDILIVTLRASTSFLGLPPPCQLIFIILSLVCSFTFAKGKKYNSQELQPIIEQFLQSGSYIRIGETYPRYRTKNVITDIVFEWEVLYISFSDGKTYKYDLERFTFELDKNNNLLIN